MGGRGRSSGADQKQINMEMVLLTLDVERIKKEADAIRASMDSFGGSGGVPATKMKQCFCCEEYSILAGTEHECCPICGWIDDKFQNKNPDSIEGRNPISLNEARKQYLNKSNTDKIF